MLTGLACCLPGRLVTYVGCVWASRAQLQCAMFGQQAEQQIFSKKKKSRAAGSSRAPVDGCLQQMHAAADAHRRALIAAGPGRRRCATRCSPRLAVARALALQTPARASPCAGTDEHKREEQTKTETLIQKFLLKTQRIKTKLWP